MSDPTVVPMIELGGGVQIHQLGFGVFKVPADQAKSAVLTAIESGYRHIDTAALYANEEGVGEAMRESGVPREELFVTTKVWNSEQGYDKAIASAEASLGRLGLDYMDLLLVHWPMPAVDLYVDTWKALIEVQKRGLTRAIGVSNFHEPHLQRVIDETGVTPCINQIELSPYLQQKEVRAAGDRLGVVTESWSPLARGGDLMADPVIAAIAADLGVTPAQVILRWHLQIGAVVIPKSVTPARIRENFDLFGFELSADHMAQIDGLDRDGRIGPNPDDFNG